MNQSAKASAPTTRKMTPLPLPTHKLITRVAARRGQSMSDAIYVVFRDELRRLGDGDPWENAPAPFTVKPTYLEDACAVLIRHPNLPPLILTADEATSLGRALHTAATKTLPRSNLTTEIGGNAVSVMIAGFHVALIVDGKSAPMIYPAVPDLADALIGASTVAGPLPKGEAQ